MSSIGQANPHEGGARAYTGTPSLDQQRVEVPTLDEQLSAYEARQALLTDEPEDIDPVTAQRVYLLLAVVVGALLAGFMGSAAIGAFVLFR